MKIAVYTIALNEEKFVQTWYNSAKDADYLLIADTGSNDGTVELAKSLGINVISIGINPWRFDDARNASLSAIPLDIDYCIALDMDEQLQPGWRKAFDKIDGINITRPRYKYTWSWNEDGTPGLQYGGDKIHKRKGYRWKHPVHEVLTADRTEETQTWIDLEIHHHPDDSKSRGQYMPLLELSVREDPWDDRNAFYYARELYFHNKLEEAAVEFKRHLELPRATWKAERAASMRYLAKCEADKTDHWLYQAIAEDPYRREPFVELALYFYARSNWQKSYEIARAATAIETKPLDYLCEDFAWGALPYDLIAISAYNLKFKDDAIKYQKLALELEPDNERFIKNLKYFEEMED